MASDLDDLLDFLHDRRDDVGVQAVCNAHGHRWSRKGTHGEGQAPLRTGACGPAPPRRRRPLRFGVEYHGS